MQDEDYPDHAFINTLPHQVTLVRSGRKSLTLPAAKKPARVRQSPVGEFMGVAIYGTRDGQVDHLPDPRPNTMYLVSRIVKDAVPKRIDCVVPDQLVRDPSTGSIIGARRVAQ